MAETRRHNIFQKRRKHMLSKNYAEVIHPLFGRIRLEQKFAKVLNIKFFRDLAYKSQLGTKTISTEVLNAKHTRLVHSIGVMYLTEKLLDACEKKFSKYFSITEREREILKLAALGHDGGHVAFSHSLEERGMKTHEQRTIEYFEENAEKINQIFGYDITAEVIKIYQSNMDVKKKGNSYKLEDNLDILFIFTSLLIGTIDCDRMEYLMTDKFVISGDKVDFTNLFNYITIVLLNDFPTVGFEKEAIPMIESFLITRFDQYEYMYYAEEPTMLEMFLKRYKKVKGWTEKEVENITEYGLLSELHDILYVHSEVGTEKWRLAQIILGGDRENIMFKKFKDDDEYEYFIKKLKSVTVREDLILTAYKKVTIYDPAKNKVYIKDSDGVIKDITEVSQKIGNTSLSMSYVAIDLDSVYGISEEEKKNIYALFEDNAVEIEKKFILEDELGDSGSIENLHKISESVLQKIEGISMQEWKMVENDDIYYQLPEGVPEGTAIRYRKNEKSYYIKTPTDDGTSITKREEGRFPNCEKEEDFMLLASAFFYTKGYYLPKQWCLKEDVTIKTHRYKTKAKIYGSLIEIACDFSTYGFGTKVGSGLMLECELKEGEDLALWYLTKELKKAGLIETNQSKQARAKEVLGL